MLVYALVCIRPVTLLPTPPPLQMIWSLTLDVDVKQPLVEYIGLFLIQVRRRL